MVTRIKKPTLTSSRKSKGRTLQKLVRDVVLKTFKELEPDDVRSTSMGAGGVDLQLSPLAKRLFPFSLECKNQEAVNVWASYEQAKKNTLKDTKPLLVIKRNRTDPLVVIALTDFMELV